MTDVGARSVTRALSYSPVPPQPTKSHFQSEWKRFDLAFRPQSLCNRITPSSPHSSIHSWLHPPPPLPYVFSTSPSLSPFQINTQTLFICPIWENSPETPALCKRSKKQGKNQLALQVSRLSCSKLALNDATMWILFFFFFLIVKKIIMNKKKLWWVWGAHLLPTSLQNDVKGLLTESMWLVLWYYLSQVAVVSDNAYRNE